MSEIAPWKAESPMDVTDDPKVTALSAVALWKEDLPRLVTEFEMETDVR